MIRIIFTLLFFFVVALLGIWINSHSFAIDAKFLNYRVETTSAKLTLVVFVLGSFFYALVRLIGWIKNSPVNFARSLKKDRQKQAYRDLMQGFSALAGADVSYAKKLADRAEKALEAEPLVKLLQAQIAVVAGKPVDAEKYYAELAKTESSRIVGYRGLISQALASNETERALKLAEDLQKLNPNSHWANGAIIDLALREQDWRKAEAYVEKARKADAITRDEAREKLAVIYYFYAKQMLGTNDSDRVIEHLHKALKYNSNFLPALILLAEIYLVTEEFKKAEKLIETVWKTQTHPMLAEVYEKICDKKNPEKKLKKFERLYKINSQDVDSVATYAAIAIKLKQPELAKQVLEKILQKIETKKLCALMGMVDPQKNWNEREKAAKADKNWVCELTGVQYANWQAFSGSGFFNTIVWDFPSQKLAIQNPMDSFLLIK